MPKLQIDPSGDVAVHLTPDEYEALVELFEALDDEIAAETAFDTGTAIEDALEVLYSFRQYIDIVEGQGAAVNWKAHGFRDFTAPVIEPPEEA